MENTSPSKVPTDRYENKLPLLSQVNVAQKARKASESEIITVAVCDKIRKGK